MRVLVTIACAALLMAACSGEERAAKTEIEQYFQERDALLQERVDQLLEYTEEYYTFIRNDDPDGAYEFLEEDMIPLVNGMIIDTKTLVDEDEQREEIIRLNDKIVRQFELTRDSAEAQAQVMQLRIEPFTAAEFRDANQLYYGALLLNEEMRVVQNEYHDLVHELSEQYGVEEENEIPVVF